MTAISIRLLSFVCCLIVIIFISQARVEADVTSQQFHYFCDQNKNRGNYTANSTYDKNLNTLLSTLTSNTKIDYGFYNSSYGQNTNKVNGIGLCRGDMKPDECRSCLDSSRANLTQICPNRKEAIGWYNDEKCMLRYSDRSIFGLEETGPAYYAWNLNNATDADQFNEVVKNLLNSIRSKAASGDSRSKYGTGSAHGSGNQTVYGLVQCTPDLSGQACDDCLAQSIKELPDCCKNRIGARIIRPSCNLRYETSSLFYAPLAEAPSPSPSPPLSPSSFSSPTPSSPEGTSDIMLSLRFFFSFI